MRSSDHPANDTVGRTIGDSATPDGDFATGVLALLALAPANVTASLVAFAAVTCAATTIRFGSSTRSSDRAETKNSVARWRGTV